MINETEYSRLRAKLVIDPLDLDSALINLAMEQMDVAECVATASTIRDQCRFDKERIEADVAANMRNSDTKISEKRIESEIVLYDEVLNAHNRLVEADRDLALWKGLADSIRTKSSSIRAIADLIQAGYRTNTTLYNERKDTIHQYRMQQQPSG